METENTKLQHAAEIVDSESSNNTKFPYVVEIVDNECYNQKTGELEETPVYVSEETLRFHRWEEAVSYFFQWRIGRDFCYGMNFVENSKCISRMEFDEGGYTEYHLHKWPGFDDCRVVKYTLERDNSGEKKEFDTYEGLNEWIRSEFGKDAFVYWKDDTAGRVGWVKDSNGGSTDWIVFNDSHFIETGYSKERREKARKRDEEIQEGLPYAKEDIVHAREEIESEYDSEDREVLPF